MNNVKHKLNTGQIAKARRSPDVPVTGVSSHFTVSAPNIDATPQIKKKVKKPRLKPIKSILNRDLFEIFLAVISIFILVFV